VYEYKDLEDLVIGDEYYPAIGDPNQIEESYNLFGYHCKQIPSCNGDL